MPDGFAGFDAAQDAYDAQMPDWFYADEDEGEDDGWPPVEPDDYAEEQLRSFDYDEWANL